MLNSKEERFKFRFKDSFLKEYSLLQKAEKRYLSLKDNVTVKDKTIFSTQIKRTYELGWQTMKDYLKAHSIELFLPRKIILAMQNEIPAKPWLSMLECNSAYILTHKERILDVFIANYFVEYKKAFAHFCSFFEQKMNVKIETVKQRRKIPHSNHSVLDSCSFSLFINYFMKNPKISFVRIYGSRAGYDFRAASDIDFLIGGKYTQEEFVKIKQELNALRQPYFLKLLSMDELNTSEQKESIEKYMKCSIPFFERKDFI